MLIYAEDPGAANWIIPLIPALKERNRPYTLVSEPALSSYFEARGVKVSTLDPKISAREMIHAHAPHLVLVGTSENFDSRGLDLIDAASAAGIPSVSFVDQGANAEHRFRGHSSNPLAHAPDWLFVPDEDTRHAFTQLGYSHARIVVSGNPHLDRVRDVVRDLEQEGRPAVRARVAPDAPEGAAWVSSASFKSTAMASGPAAISSSSSLGVSSWVCIKDSMN